MAGKEQPTKPTLRPARSGRVALGKERPDGDAVFPAAAPKAQLPPGYGDALNQLKTLVHETRLRTVLSANAGMIQLYWNIGGVILDKQAREGWGAKVIDRLSSDLRQAFPDMSGFSPRNLKYMRAFAAAWPDPEIVQRALHHLPWGVNVQLLDSLKEPDSRLWYAQQAAQHGWSRDILVIQIERQLHRRQGKAITNFDQTLPPPQSDMAAQVFRDPYLFDFLGTGDPRREREVEQALVDHVQKFLLELGAGFAFVGRQVPLEVGDADFKVDLLFYHFKLHCFVVVELKAGPFKPEYAGKLNFYLSAVDDLLKGEADSPSIGLLLCKSKNHLQAEYALRDVNKPIGVADWSTSLVEKLPKALEGSLPTIEEIEAELANSGEDME